MQPTNGPILPGTNLTSTRTDVETKGLVAPKDVDSTSDRQPFRRVLRQERDADGPTVSSAAEPDQGGSDLPSAGNKLPSADAESAGSADSTAGANPAKPAAVTAVDGSGSEPDNSDLPVLTNAVAGAGELTAAVIEEGRTLARADRQSTLGPRSLTALGQTAVQQPVTSQLPVLTDTVTGPLAEGTGLTGRLAAATDRTLGSVEQRQIASQLAQRALVSSSRPVAEAPLTDLAAKSSTEVAVTTALNLRQLSSAAAGRADSPLDQALRSASDTFSPPAGLQGSASGVGARPSTPAGATRLEALQI